MSKFKVGDRVRQLSEDASPFAVITKIEGREIHHRHENGDKGWEDEVDFELAPRREEIIYLDE